MFRLGTGNGTHFIPPPLHLIPLIFAEYILGSFIYYGSQVTATPMATGFGSFFIGLANWFTWIMVMMFLINYLEVEWFQSHMTSFFQLSVLILVSPIWIFLNSQHFPEQWLMWGFILLVSTLFVFLPHTILSLIKNLGDKREEKKEISRTAYLDSLKESVYTEKYNEKRIKQIQSNWNKELYKK